MKEINKAIKIARTVHDRSDGPADGTAVILGALIRAVELLAEQVDRPTTNAEAVEMYEATKRAAQRAFQDESLEKVGVFDDGLVKKLARISWNAQMADESIRSKMPKWENYPEEFKRSGEVGVRAILSELASMPREWPTVPNFDAVRNAYYHTKPTAGLEAVMVLYEQRLTPILAAKDARIAELELERTNTLKKDPPTNSVGATPAHTARNAFLNEFGLDSNPLNQPTGDELEAWERVACAILDSYGGTSEAMQSAQNKIAQLTISENAARDILSRQSDELAKTKDELRKTERNYQQLINPLKQAALPIEGVALVAQIERERKALEAEVAAKGVAIGSAETRIAELEKEIMRQRKVISLQNRVLETESVMYRDTIRAAEARIDDLENRIAELENNCDCHRNGRAVT